MSTILSKDAKYYLGLNYAVSLRRLSSEDGGGFVATIPQLGDQTFVAVGDTREEALDALDELRHILIPMLVERGTKLPEPLSEEENIESYSGSLMLRVPRSLHAHLSMKAKQNGCSINKLATQFLAQGLTAHSIVRETKETLSEIIFEQIQKALREPQAEMPRRGSDVCYADRIAEGLPAKSLYLHESESEYTVGKKAV